MLQEVGLLVDVHPEHLNNLVVGNIGDGNRLLLPDVIFHQRGDVQFLLTEPSCANQRHVERWIEIGASRLVAEILPAASRVNP